MTEAGKQALRKHGAYVMEKNKATKAKKDRCQLMKALGSSIRVEGETLGNCNKYTESQWKKYAHKGPKASTGYCVAWDSWKVINGPFISSYPRLWTKNQEECGNIGQTWNSDFKYGKSSTGGKTITNKMAVQPLANSGDKNKGMLLFKRVVCDVQPDSSKAPTACAVFKMGQCLRCTATKWMHEKPTMHKSRGKIQGGKVVFADRMGDGKAKSATQIAEEKRNFARCAMDLLKKYPTWDLPAENQCSYYCRTKCTEEKSKAGHPDNPHNKNCHVKSDDEGHRRWCHNSPNDELLAEQQLSAF